MSATQAIAVRKETTGQGNSSRQYLSFTLGEEHFAVPIEHVREIIEFDTLTTIPLMPPFLRGVINLRGAVVPVVDLQRRFGRGETQVGKRTCIVIAEVAHAEERHPLGAIVDSVNEVVSVESGQIEEKPAFGTRLRSDFVDGILNLEGRFVIALDVDKVLSVEEMAAMVGATFVPSEESA
jgi:purine-binding chemotaxis protein CheW